MNNDTEPKSNNCKKSNGIHFCVGVMMDCRHFGESWFHKGWCEKALRAERPECISPLAIFECESELENEN